MPARKHAEPWVLTLRDTLKAEVGAAYRIGEQRGKAKLDVRFDDGSRKTTNLDIQWLPVNARTIRERVEKIAGLIAGGHTLASAVEQLTGKTKSAPISTNPAINELMASWNAYGEDKGTRGAIEPTTWKNDYSATGKRLLAVGDAPNAIKLLEMVARGWKPGIRQRKQSLQQVRSMLEWATGPEGDYRLSAERWTPPPKGGLSRFYGEKSAAQKAKDEEPTVPFTDAEILELLEALPINSNHPRNAQAAKQWKFAFQLMATYGLRPVEIHHLELRERNGKLTPWCNWIKRTGGGSGKPRRLFPRHPEWETDWNLLERLERGEALPPKTNRKVGHRALEYLKRMSVFQPMWERGCVSKSFRHAYSYRCHTIYGEVSEVVAKYMGHQVEVHNSSYSEWSSEDQLEAAAERGLRYREMTKGNG